MLCCKVIPFGSPSSRCLPGWTAPVEWRVLRARGCRDLEVSCSWC